MHFSRSLVPLTACPPPFKRANYKSASDHPSVVDEFVAMLVARGRAVRCSSRPHLVAPLGVAFRATDLRREKGRVVYDATASGLNAACPAWPFAYDSVPRALRRTARHCYLATVDLKKWFTQLGMHPAFHRLCGFRWRGVYYTYTSVPFGLSLAPAFASAVSAAISRMARALGINVVSTYIDDFLIAAPSRASAQWALDRFLSLLRRLGVEYGPEKVAGPSQRLPFLGITIDTARAELTLSPARASALRAALSAAAASAHHARWLESLAGKLAWYSVVAPGLRPELSAVYACISAAHSPAGARLSASAAARAIAAIDAAGANPEPVWCWLPPRGNVLLRTDASGEIGYGGHVGLRAFARPWQPSWAACRSMTARELWPVAEALRLWPALFRNRVALAATDNSAMVFALCRFSSGCPRSLRIIRLIVARCAALRCSIIPCHLPRAANEVADALSRFRFSWTGFLPAPPASASNAVAVRRAVHALAQLRDRPPIHRVLHRGGSAALAPVGRRRGGVRHPPQRICNRGVGFHRAGSPPDVHV